MRVILARMRGTTVEHAGLFFLLKRAHHELVEHAARKVTKVMGVPSAQVAALVHLEQSEGCSVRELGDQLGLNSAGATGVVARLERKRLVRRVRSTTDARVATLWLSARGRKIARDVGPLLASFDRELRRGFDAAELATVQRFLEHILHTFATGDAT